MFWRARWLRVLWRRGTRSADICFVRLDEKVSWRLAGIAGV